MRGKFQKNITPEAFILAICIAILPPIWAIAAPYIGIQTGAVALICGGFYVANGNKRNNAMKISIGFLLGDLWAVFSLKIMEIIVLNENLELFVTLCIFGGLAVIISTLLSKWIYCASWLCGWAIGLTILPSAEANTLCPLPFQIAVSMLIGVWYIGVGIDSTQKILMRATQKLILLNKRTDYEKSRSK